MGKVKEIIKFVLDDLEKVFPFFVVFYLIVVISSYFYPFLKQSVNWLVLHLSFFGFVIFFLIRILRNSAKMVFYVQRIKEVAVKIKPVDWVKLFLILVVFSLCLYFKISFLSLLILVFGTSSFLFVWDSRMSAGVALILLVTCVVFLLFKKEIIAEQVAIISYYFLIITALTALREMRGGGDKYQ